MRTRLYVIQKHGTDQFWASSSEHGSGWSPGRPKQSFSPSEITNQLRLLMDNDWFCDCDILELVMPATAHAAGAGTVSDELATMRLTDAEREAVERAAVWMMTLAQDRKEIQSAAYLADDAATLRAFLERHTKGGET